MPFRLTRRALLLGATAVVPGMRGPAKELRRARRTLTVAERLAAIEARLGGRLGVAALDTHSGAHVEHRAAERFPMCSTFKFLLVAAILSRVDAHREELDRFLPYTKADLLDYAPIAQAHVQEGGMTISMLCAAAIEYSDNTAANLLLATLGGPPGVTAYARSLGDPVTRLDRDEPSLNTALAGDPRDTTTPSAMLDDMRKLLINPGALSSDARNVLGAWMIGNATGAAGLRAGLPSAWRVGQKTGSGRNGSTNDIAVCWPPHRAPILVTAYFTGSSASSADCSAGLAEVGRMVGGEFS